MRVLLVLAGMAMLSACGGGDGGSSGSGPPSPPPANTRPQFTSATTASFAENATGTVYQATATDADNDPVAYTLAGNDAAQFNLTLAGALSFRAPPNFEAPGDTDRNNAYDVQISASDGQGATTLNLRVTVTNVIDVRLRNIGNYTNLSDMARVPGEPNLILVARRDGQIFLRDVTQAGPGVPYLTVVNTSFGVIASQESGLLDVVAAPDYETTGVIYVSLTEANGDFVVRRYGRLAGIGNPASADVIFRLPRQSASDADFGNIGGWLEFSQPSTNRYVVANMLYIGVGLQVRTNSEHQANTGGYGTFPGRVLRIDVRGDSFPTDPDRDYLRALYNVYVNNDDATPETYSRGYYSPRRGFIQFDGPLLVPDLHTKKNGQPYPQKLYSLFPDIFLGYITSPIARLTYGSEAGASPEGFVGGPAYDGVITDLQGLYLFGDLGGPIRAVPSTALSSSLNVSPGFPGEGLLRQISDPASGFRGVGFFGYDWSDRLYVGEYVRGDPVAGLFVVETS